MGPAVAHYPQKASTRQCPKCGSMQICASRRHNLLDWFLGALLVNPYRCMQCMRRFFRFRSAFARRAIATGLCLLPVAVLAAWFVGLYRLHQARAAAPVEQPAKRGTLSPADINKLLSTP